jgi:hypothetical protein
MSHEQNGIKSNLFIGAVKVTKRLSLNTAIPKGSDEKDPFTK